MDDLKPLEPDDSSPKEPRKGSARERRDRRRQRGQHVSAPTSARARLTQRQLTPAGGFKMPQITIPHTRLLFSAAAGLLAIVLVIAILARLKNNAPQLAPNGIWIGTHWTYENPGNDELVALASRLRDNRIGTVYAWVSLLNANNAWAGANQSDSFDTVKDKVKGFVQQFRLVYPNVRLYGWVSIPALGAPNRLSDTKVQQTVADFSQQIVTDMGFDGVFINVDGVTDNNENYLTLLRQVRDTIGITKSLSVGVPPDWTPTGADIPISRVYAPGTVWSDDYKQRVALIADQLAVMAFNSGLTINTDYSQWLAYQVKTFSDAVAQVQDGKNPVKIVIGISTDLAQLPTHDPAVENVNSALSGIRLGLQQAGANAQFVQGVAIYPEWSTDDSEWADFQAGESQK